MKSPVGSLGLRGIASVDVFVHDLERSRRHFGQALDFAEVAVSSEDWERRSSEKTVVMLAGDTRFSLVTPIADRGEAFDWLKQHPEGVGRISFEVADVQHTYTLLTGRGATPISGVLTRSAEGATLSWFDIVTPIGSTILRFVQMDKAAPVVPGTVHTPRAGALSNRFSIGTVDHITCNFLTLKPAILWMQEVLGLLPYWGVEFHTQEVQASDDSGSGLKSIVMWDPESGVKFANNEPAAPRFKASQIYTFCRDHRGAGVQHVALTVRDLVQSVQLMQTQGLSFVPTPAAYYQRLPGRLADMGIEKLDVEIEKLMELGILVDGAGAGRHLLQIFMREASALFADVTAGPMFLELIQRKGDNGFGAGNFRALFESLERQQTPDRSGELALPPLAATVPLKTSGARVSVI